MQFLAKMMYDKVEVGQHPVFAVVFQVENLIPYVLLLFLPRLLNSPIQEVVVMCVLSSAALLQFLVRCLGLVEEGDGVGDNLWRLAFLVNCAVAIQFHQVGALRAWVGTQQLYNRIDDCRFPGFVSLC